MATTTLERSPKPLGYLSYSQAYTTLVNWSSAEFKGLMAETRF